MPIFEVCEMLGVTVGRGAVERVGPCPDCGGTDRFGVNSRKNVFQCRRCGAKGGPVNLVMLVRHCTFPEALDWLLGPRAEMSAAEKAARAEKLAAQEAKRDAEAKKYHDAAVAQARKIWARAVPAEGTLVREYLERRGVSRGLFPRLPPCLRFDDQARYMVPDRAEQRGWREIWRGPAMVASVVGRDGRLSAVHRTWLDLSQPKGKWLPIDPAGRMADLPAKKVHGSKKGGFIPLSTPGGAEVLVMGEGIETTLSALVAAAIPGAAYWAGVDLGNMAGRRESGPGLKYAGRPDLTDVEAFVPPAWVRRLIYVMDGDSEPRLTRAMLEAGLRRAMALRPGLRGQVVEVPAGRDLNDVLMGAGDDRAD